MLDGKCCVPMVELYFKNATILTFDIPYYDTKRY